MQSIVLLISLLVLLPGYSDARGNHYDTDIDSLDNIHAGQYSAGKRENVYNATQYFDLESCGPGALYGQDPHFPEDFWESPASDQSTPENLIVYENFTMSHNNVCNIQWWGLNLMFNGSHWMECSKSVDYMINFYQNNAGQPGALIASRMVYPSKTGTGILYDGFELLSFEATLTPCVMVDQAWISIQAMADSGQPDCWFHWMSSEGGDGMSYQWDGMEYIQHPYDLSMCLIGALPTNTPLPPTSTPMVPTNTPGPPTHTPTTTPTATPTPTITPTFPPMPGDDCPGIPFECNTCLTGSTVGYLNQHDCGAGHEGSDRVYELTIPVDTTVTIIGEADFDADWTLATTCDYLNGDLGCFDWTEPHIDPSCGAVAHATYGYLNITTFLPAGVYYLWIDGFYSDSMGNFSIELHCDTSPTPIPTATTTPGVPGDHCDNAIDISMHINMHTYPVSIPGDSMLASNYYALASCSFDGAMGPELVYSFTPDMNRTLTFDLCSEGGSLSDSVMYVRTDGPCPGNSEVVCDDDGCINPETEWLSVTPCREYLEGVTYYLFIDSYSDSIPGTFTLNVNSCDIPVCDPSSVFGQNPDTPDDFWTAYVSDMSSAGNLKTFENFNIGAQADLCGIQWWGLLLEDVAGEWVPCSKTVDYTIEFYTDVGDQPGTLLGTYTVTPVMTDTGLMYEGYPLISFQSDLTPCISLADGWISVQANASAGSPDCLFFWMSSPSGDVLSYQWDGMELVANMSDISLCLEGVVVIPTSTPTYTPTPVVSCINHGDVNADGIHSAGDAQLAFMIALGLYSPTITQFCAADCNADGLVTAGDAQMIFLTALGSGNCADPIPVLDES